MKTSVRLACAHHRNIRVQLPTGHVVTIDENGLTEEVPTDVAEVACQVPGYVIVSEHPVDADLSASEDVSEPPAVKKTRGR